MATEQYQQELVPQNYINKENKASLDKWESLSEAIDESKNNVSSDFDCNICLDTVQDPVVTLCGHLYCWPCIYKWIHQQSTSSEFPHKLRSLCPVCKSEISEKTIVPLYIPGTRKPTSAKMTLDLGIVIPSRPSTPRCWVPTMPPHQLDYRGYQQQAPNVINPTSPTTAMFGELVYERLFGNVQTSLLAYPNSYNLAGISTRRARRQAIQAERSLSRLCFFLSCCIMLCLILF